MMAILDPIKVVIDNYPEGQVDYLEIDNNLENPELGKRQVPFTRELYIDREDFMEEPPKKFFRLGPGLMVRLKSAYIVRCDDFKKDSPDVSGGNVTEIHCTYFPESKSGHDKSGLQTKGVIHWVSVAHAVNSEVRLYDRLFKVENPAAEEGDFKTLLNPDSLHVITNAKAEQSLNETKALDTFQFMRKGYFCTDTDSTANHLVFNRTVTLKDAWAKQNH